MDTFDRRSGSEQPLLRTSEPAYRPGRGRSGSRDRTPKSYRFCDGATAALICFMIVFTPWAFGTTQDWSIWTMNITGFILGGVLLAKGIIRWRTGYSPPRWGKLDEEEEDEFFQLKPLRRDPLTLALAALTVLVLGYILVSAVNARASYIEWQRRFEYRDCIRWLPHSYDSASTWQALWMYSGLACFFWAARDWLLGKPAPKRKRRGDRAQDPADAVLPDAARHRLELPGRLRLLLWVLCINGSILALEAILQRLSGTNRLLWLVQPSMNHDTLSQFGPYAYRANAASYFNLVWPVCLGFWLVLRQSAKPSLRTGKRVGSGNHLVLMPGAVLMAACPIISTSRGGALIAVAAILVTMTLLLWITRKESLWLRLGTCSLFAVILIFSAALGLKQLVPRFQTIFTDQMSQRTEIYRNALPIAHDFPMFGTGPGAFGALYQLYRASPEETWNAYVHDDWLETRITFGWVGFTLILLMLGMVVARWFWGGGIPVSWELPTMIWVAVGGGLLHAKFDFPLQIYSILFLFLLLAAILFCVSGRRQQA